MILAKPTVPGFCCNIWPAMKLAESKVNGFLPSGNGLEWLHRIPEYPEFEGTHKGHWSPAPGPTQGHEFFLCFPFLNMVRISWCSGIYTVVSTSPAPPRTQGRISQVKQPNKPLGLYRNSTCAHTKSPHSSLGPTRAVIKTQIWMSVRRNYCFTLYCCVIASKCSWLCFPPALLHPVN